MIGPEQLAAGERAEAEGDFLTAMAAYRAVASVDDESLAADAHFHLGRVHWKQGRLPQAFASFEDALALTERIGTASLRARIENGIGAIEYAQGDHAAARRAYRAALDHAEDDAIRARVVLNIGVIEVAEDNPSLARQHYERARTLFEGVGDHGGAALALHNLGMLEAHSGQWAVADHCFRIAIERAELARDRELLARALLNRAEALIERRALDDAVAHCDRALAIHADLGDEIGRGEALRWRAHALTRAGDLVAAERNAAEALQIAIRSKARLLEAQAARDLGTLRRMLGDRLGGIKQLRRAEALFATLGSSRDIAEVAERLARTTPTSSSAAIP
jgi:tetratricopeptide (TPR) repeat protein